MLPSGNISPPTGWVQEYPDFNPVEEDVYYSKGRGREGNSVRWSLPERYNARDGKPGRDGESGVGGSGSTNLGGSPHVLGTGIDARRYLGPTFAVLLPNKLEAPISGFQKNVIRAVFGFQPSLSADNRDKLTPSQFIIRDRLEPGVNHADILSVTIGGRDTRNGPIALRRSEYICLLYTSPSPRDS